MIHFKKAEPIEAQKIAMLVNSAYRGEHAKLGWTTEAYLLDGNRTDPELITEMIQSADSEILLALDESKTILGCANLIREQNSLYFGMLTVAPTLQNQGIAKELMRELERQAKELNYRALRITVIKGRPELVAYYERFGFKKTGKVEKFPEDPRYGIPIGEIPILEEYIKQI